MAKKLSESNTSIKEHQNVYVVSMQKKEVIISAGSFYTPQLLLLSGIGPKAQLENFNIPVVAENDHVGAHFKYHYGVLGTFTGGFPGSLPVLSFPNITTPRGTSRDAEMIFLPTFSPSAITSACIGTVGGTRPDNGLGTLIAWNLSPRSEGNISLADANPLTEPLVNFNSYSDGDLTDPNSDASKSVKLFKTMRQIAFSIGQDSAFPVPADYLSNAKLFQDALLSPNFSNHYMSTCRMAQTSQGIDGGVVDGQLRVHDVRKLRIMDLSIVPSNFVPKGNTAVMANIIGIVGAQALGATTIP